MLGDWILKLLGFWCDESSARKPPPLEKKKSSGGGNHFGKDTRHRNGSTFKTRHLKDGLIEEIQESGKTGNRTAGDEWLFLNHNDWKGASEKVVKKYFELKPYWAKGLSSKDASTVFLGKYGYGERTLDKFWSAFNESLRFDLEQKTNTKELHA